MFGKTKKSLEAECTGLRKESQLLAVALEEKHKEVEALKLQIKQTTTALAAEATRVSKEISGLVRENNALRQELAQAQSALYTLINKLPRLPEQEY